MVSGLVLALEAFLDSYGMVGAFSIAVLESFIFPIPTAVFIAPFTALGVNPALITIVATAGSLVGAVIGYLLGRHLGRPVADRLFKKHVPRVEKWFDRYGAWAVFIAAFTPVPFKVFTWCSGIFGLEFRKFIVAAIPGRLLQFAIAAYAGNVFGPWFLGLL